MCTKKNKSTKASKPIQWSHSQILKYQMFLLLYFTQDDEDNTIKIKKIQIFKKLSYLLQGSKTKEQCAGHHKKLMKRVLSIDRYTQKIIFDKYINRHVGTSHIRKQIKKHLRKIRLRNEEFDEQINDKVQRFISKYYHLQQAMKKNGAQPEKDIEESMIQEEKTHKDPFIEINSHKIQRKQVQSDFQSSVKTQKNTKIDQQSQLFDVLNWTSSMS